MSTLDITSGPGIWELFGKIRKHEKVEFATMRDGEGEIKKYFVKPLVLGAGVLTMEVSRNVGGTLLTYVGYYNYASGTGNLEFAVGLSRI